MHCEYILSGLKKDAHPVRMPRKQECRGHYRQVPSALPCGRARYCARPGAWTVLSRLEAKCCHPMSLSQLLTTFAA